MKRVCDKTNNTHNQNIVVTNIWITFASTSPISMPPSWWKRIVSPCLWE